MFVQSYCQAAYDSVLGPAIKLPRMWRTKEKKTITSQMYFLLGWIQACGMGNVYYEIVIEALYIPIINDFKTVLVVSLLVILVF